MKKIKYILLFFPVLLLLTTNIAFSAFSDLSSEHTNYDAIDYVMKSSIVSGYPDGTFRPNRTINRAEFTKIVVGASFSLSDINSYFVSNPVLFPDVPRNEWFAKYVAFARKENIIAGYSDGNFRPAQNINFAEAAKIIVNAFGYKTFSDNVWYRPFVEKLSEKKAVPSTITDFNKNVTRGEMAEMIYRLLAKITNKPSRIYSQLAGIKKVFSEKTNVSSGKTPKVTDYSDSSFIRAKANGTPLLYFRADWCPTCRALDKELEKDISSLPDGLTILRIDYDTAKDLKKRYGVIYQHTLVQLDGSGKVVKKWTGGGISTILQQLGAVSADASIGGADIKEFDIVARQWEFVPSNITVKKGDIVRLNIKNIDVPHGIAITELNLNEALPVGKTTVVEFKADKKGSFSFFCSVYCGAGHRDMKGVLIVK